MYNIPLENGYTLEVRKVNPIFFEGKASERGGCTVFV